MNDARDHRADEDEPAEVEAAADEAGDEPAEDESTAAPAESDWQRRRRLAAVFGDVLPETTGDEREPGEAGSSDDWLRRQVPPHHG